MPLLIPLPPLCLLPLPSYRSPPARLPSGHPFLSLSLTFTAPRVAALECDVDTVRAVLLVVGDSSGGSGSVSLYFEWERPPCVEVRLIGGAERRGGVVLEVVLEDGCTGMMRTATTERFSYKSS